MSAIQVSVRPIRAGDLDPVIALDRQYSGQSRRGFFEQRWQAMAREPSAFIALAAQSGDDLVGFLLAHILDGEFGGTAPVAVMDALGVATDVQGRGIGSELMGRLIDEVRARGGRELRTQAPWHQRGLLDFFAQSGFVLAPRTVFERNTLEMNW